MNWQLVTSLALNLGASSFNVGVATQSQIGLVTASFQNVQTISPSTKESVAFVIDTSSVANWDTLNVGADFIDIGSATTGSVEMELPTEDQPVVSASLLADDVTKSGGGEDVLVFGRKDTLEFSAENSAKAGLILFVPAFNVTLEETLQAYDMFEDHPKFDELVAIYETYKGIPVDFDVLGEAGTLEGEIVSDIITQIRSSGL